MTGYVSLVGAGPGDPELLTLKARNRLARADVVFYDALVDDDVRALGPQARWFYVGKRSGRHSLAQETITKLLVRSARRGRRVVRLKCGDPFVFGRGGEEALGLREAGVPFEVVPGVSSAIAAPAWAGIPVTHRGLASASVIVTGHAASAYGPVLSSLAPNTATVVVLMGLRNRAAIADTLLARGWTPQTPAAIVLDATHASAARWLGTLGSLGGTELPGDGDEAGIIVVGAVVSLASAIGNQHDGDGSADPETNRRTALVADAARAGGSRE